MTIRKRSRIKNKLSHILNRLRMRLENEFGGGFESNGEQHFMQEVAREYAGTPIIAFDVGASVGEYSEILFKEVKKQSGILVLHAFEPLAKYSGPGIANAVALSDTDGHVTMYSRGNEETSSVYRGKNLDKKHGNVREVTVPTV